MNLKGADLLVTDAAGEEHRYVLTQDKAYGNPVVHEKGAVSVPLNTGYSSPTQAGGLYDVRDSEGDKAIAHLDWTLGAGQKTLDREGATSSKFWKSQSIDISRPGELRLARSVADVHEENMAGPVYSALGKIWVGDSLGGLKYSADNGATWTDCDGYTSTRPITCFASDGTRLYIGFAAGTSYGIYANTAGDLNTFAKFPSTGTGTTEAIRHLAYFSGYLLAATTSKAAIVNSTTGVFGGSSDLETPNWLNTTMTSVALVAAGNAAYWVVGQGGRSYVYELSISDASGLVMTTQQYTELPTGFVATCALGYLSSVYVGGYFESVEEGVGKGAVYECSPTYTGPLFELGEYPETTADPDNIENDNRIWAITNASKDIYVLTNRSAYRWDIDDGGYSHAFDYPGSGSGELLQQWDSGSIYSWDGNEAVPNIPPHYMFPTGYTVSISGGGVPTWDYAGGVATLSCATSQQVSTYTAVGSPAGADALDNAAGTTFEIIFGTMVGWRATTITLPFECYIRDGTREMMFRFSGVDEYGVCAAYLYQWTGSAWAYLSSVQTSTGQGHTLRAVLKGVTATLYLDTLAPISTNLTRATTDAARIVNVLTAGYVYTGSSFGWKQLTCAINSWTLNSVGAYPSEVIVDALFRPSIAHSRGNFMVPYADPEENKSLTITGITQAYPTEITTSAAHGIAAGGTQVVNIDDSDCTPSCDGNWAATRTSDTTFTIDFDVATSPGSAGTVTYNHETGYTHTTSGVAASGWLEQSETSFHSGTLLKDFRAVDVAHDPIPEGATLDMFWEIDGVGGNSAGTTSGTHTVFAINRQGYSIKTRISLTCDDTATASPVVRGYNVLWDFVKPVKHTYLLECKEGAGGGHWHEDAEEATAFLFSAADERCSFEDRFAGEYEGSIERVELLGANYTPREGYSGIVKLVVREQT